MINIQKYEHNKMSLAELNSAIDNRETAICTNCVGSGKSYLINRVIEKFKKPLLISPREIISENIIKETKVDFMTYCKFRKGNDYSKYDCIIFDEAHHIGSDLAMKEYEKIKNNKFFFRFLLIFI